MLTKDSLVERLRLQGTLAIRAAVFFDIWRAQTDNFTRNTYIDTMNRYSEYLIYNESAYLSSTVNAIYILTENKRNTLNIRSSLALMERWRPEHASGIEAIRTKYEAAHPLFEKIRLLRNNAFAHRSALLGYKEAFQRVRITPNELRESLSEIKRTLNSLLTLIGEEGFEFREFPRDDFIAMLEDLRAMDPQPVQVF